MMKSRRSGPRYWIFNFTFIGLPVALLTNAAGQSLPTPPEDPLGNWFNDPFMQISHSVSDCPVPIGPLIPRSEVRSEEHSRVERGTSCWLAGKCEQPNAYFYDTGISKRLAEHLAANPALLESSLWITVKRRFVWIEGCVKDPAIASELERLAKEVPNVELVFVNVTANTKGKMPYQIQ